MRNYLYAFTLLLFALNLGAQPVGIKVSGGTTMHLQGATVSVQGNVVNDGNIANDDASAWVFKGSNQSIGGSNGISFNDVTFSFSGLMAVSHTININGAANFKKGVVNMPAGAVMFFGPTATSTAVEASYVTGIVQKKGITDFTYPYGYNGRGKRVRISNITNGNANTLFAIYYHRETPPNLTAVSPGLYELNRVDYYDVTPGGNESAMLEFEVDTSDYPQAVQLNTDALRLAHYTNGLWVSEGGFSNKVFDYGVKSSANITNFSPFTLAAIRPLVLAVNRIGIEAHRVNNNQVSISWQALGNTAGVRSSVLQRSPVTPVAWADIKNITANAAGGTYIDAGLAKNTYLYRVKLIQKDGAELLSNTALVQITAAANLKVYPTLTHGEVNIVANATETIRMIEVYNNAGAKVTTIIPAGSQYKLDASGFAGGMYNLKIYVGNGSEVVRIVKY